MKVFPPWFATWLWAPGFGCPARLLLASGFHPLEGFLTKYHKKKKKVPSGRLGGRPSGPCGLGLWRRPRSPVHSAAGGTAHASPALEGHRPARVHGGTASPPGRVGGRLVRLGPGPWRPPHREREVLHNLVQVSTDLFRYPYGREAVATRVYVRSCGSSAHFVFGHTNLSRCRCHDGSQSESSTVFRAPPNRSSGANQSQPESSSNQESDGDSRRQLEATGPYYPEAPEPTRANRNQPSNQESDGDSRRQLEATGTDPQRLRSQPEPTGVSHPTKSQMETTGGNWRHPELTGQPMPLKTYGGAKPHETPARPEPATV